ncbi:MAG: leucine-rich repeat domain-containing protein, partial [Beutenbergiaceae bacterium]
MAITVRRARRDEQHHTLGGGVVVGLLAAILVLTPTTADAAPVDEVVFADPSFKECVTTALDLPVNGPVTESDLASLTTLSCTNRGITDVTPVQYATALTSLNLSHNNITSLPPLTALTSLLTLSLNSNQISDSAPLASLTSLSELHAIGNNISDISTLTTLANLDWLNLANNQIVSITGIVGMTALTELELSGNQIVDISPVSGMTTLTELNVSGNAISTLPTLTGLPALEYLFLGDNKIADVTPLAGFTDLDYLALNDNIVTDPSPLGSLSSLGVLRLDRNHITDASSLASLPGTTNVTLTAQKIDGGAAEVGTPAPAPLITTMDGSSVLLEVRAGTGTVSGDSVTWLTPTDPSRLGWDDGDGFWGIVIYTPVTPAPVPPSIDVAASSVPDGVIGQSYTGSVVVDGEPTPDVSASAGLPDGLTMSTDGTLSGTPTTAGSFTFTVTAINGVSPAASHSFTIEVLDPPSIDAAASSVPDAITDQPYSGSIVALGYPDPDLTVTSGSLPTGLTMATDGTLSGTPTVAGSYSFGVTASNGVTPAATQSFTINVTDLVGGRDRLDVTGDGLPDLLAVNPAGGLFLWPGTAAGALGPRTQIGTGWANMGNLTLGDNVTAPGSRDLIAVNMSTGALWAFPIANGQFQA